jgi:uncharacterized protein (TIGR02453 family)
MATAKATAAPAKFTGFPKEALQFYKDIGKNNNREWFEAHRGDFMEHVIGPAQAFVNELGPQLRKISPGVQFSPDHSGKGSIKKIHQDPRFVKDRAPYKQWLDIMFWEGPIGAKKDNSVFFMRITPQMVGFVTGIKAFERPVVVAYREALADPKAGKELQGIVAKLEKQGYEVRGKSLKQHPRGFDKTLPWADLALHEALYGVIDLPVPAELHSAKLADLALKHWKAMLPLHRWLVDNVLPRL